MICFSCLIIVGKVLNLSLTFVTYMSFWPWMDKVIVEVVSLSVCRNFLIIISVKYLMKNFINLKSFLIEILFVQLFLVMHRS